MDVFVTYGLGVDFAPPILLRTYYRVSIAAECRRVWVQSPLLLVGVHVQEEEQEGNTRDINHPIEPKLRETTIFSFYLSNCGWI